MRARRLETTDGTWMPGIYSYFTEADEGLASPISHDRIFASDLDLDGTLKLLLVNGYDPNPYVDDPRLRLSWFLSTSLDIDLAEVLGKVDEKLGF